MKELGLQKAYRMALSSISMSKDNTFRDHSIEEVISGRSDWIGTDLQIGLAEATLECIQKEYPHFIYSLNSPDPFTGPKKQHPIFYGCFDWHSAVHSHWSLVRQLRLLADHPRKEGIIELLDKQFTVEKAEKEKLYFDENRDFEKPYGWAWFMRLIVELELWDDVRSKRWKRNLEPLENKLLELIQDGFLEQKYPLRVGTHGNSAFALQAFWDYAKVKDEKKLKIKVEKKSREFFINDTSAPIDYEPVGWDFLSPTLVEADLMKRILDQEGFVDWLDGFLPDIGKEHQLLQPMEVELDELMKFHLVGLNLSKAWCLSSVGRALPDEHRYKEMFLSSAEDHSVHGLDQTFSRDYRGSHWLTSFALYLFTLEEDGIGPC